MKKLICNLSVAALCMGLGIASSDAQQPPRTGAGIQSEIELMSTCLVNENGQPIDEAAPGQQTSLVLEGTQIGASICGADGWSHPWTGPAKPPRGGRINPHDGKPLIPGEPSEEVLAPGATDRSWYQNVTTLDKPSTGRKRDRKKKDIDEGPR